MAAFSHEDIERIAALSQLALSANERVRFERELSSILEYAAQVRDVDTSGVPPTTHAMAGGTRWREDEETVSLPLEHVLANAPATSGGLFVVPKVIGG
jgi:aspartyl-tRNA(Asn)/glutamyl-tRNA(Gln) amidotransferase subunit C